MEKYFKLAATGCAITLGCIAVAALSQLSNARFLMLLSTTASIILSFGLFTLGWYLIKNKISIFEHVLCASALLPPLVWLGQMNIPYLSPVLESTPVIIAALIVAPLTALYLFFFPADHSRTAAILMLPIAIINFLTFIIPATLFIVIIASRFFR